MPITALPTPPSRTDTTNFAARTDAFLAALPTFQSEANALQSDVQANKNYVASAWDAAGGISVGLGQAVSAATSAAASADRAVQAWAAASVQGERLASISKSLHSGSIVESIIYDTSKDSDGGAWRKRMQDKSWYNETLGGTSWIGQQASEAVARAYVGSLASPNLVTNGTFTTDTSGWTAGNSATLSVVASRLRVTNTVALNGRASQAITTIVGKSYSVSAEQTIGTATTWYLYAGTTAGNNDVAGNTVSTSVASSNLTFVATSTTTHISLIINATSGQYTDFDNISVKLVDSAIDPANTVYQSTADGKFYKLNTTSGTTEVFRGISREFPAVVAIVAEASRVVIYDLTVSSCPMWMVFSGGNTVTGGLLSFDQSTGSIANYILSIASLNGSIFVAQGNGGNGQGLRIINFITEFTDRVGDSARLNTWRFKGNISRRNNADGGYQYSSVGLVNLTANDVAVTVLDTAPIDPATGLPVPTIAVATAGGVSVIKDDGTVSSLTLTSNSATSVSIVGDRFAYSISNSGRYIAEYSLRAMTSHTIATLDATDSQRLAMYAPTTALSIPTVSAGGPAGALVTCSNSTVAVGGPSALNLLRRNPTTQAAGMVSYITNAYNSGWLPGDIRGAYLADTTAETITASGELVTNGTFTTDTSGWTAYQGGILSVSSNQLLITNDGTGTNSGAAYQSITTVVGKTYNITYTAIAGTSGSATVRIGTAFGSANLATQTGIGSYLLSFVATTTTTFITLYTNDITASRTTLFDNISVKLADADRSVKNTGLVVNGTLTKAAVASGANLVAYSGFSVSNYLEQPYSANLDFGTGDFCVMGWINPSSLAALGYLFGRQNSGATGSRFYAYVSASTGLINFNVTDGTTSVPLSGGAALVATPAFVVCYRSGTSLYLNVNATQVATATAPSLTFNNTTAVFRLGVDHLATNPFAGSLALWRISATAPSANQIAHIYRTELPLFQAGAQCTIAGTSTAVTGLTYDDATNLLSASTAGNISRFKDLLRVSSDASTAGTITSVAAAKGMEIIGGSTSASVYTPALTLREEVNKPATSSATPQPYRQFSVKDQQAFQGQLGMKIVGVYVRGVLKKLGIDYTITYDGFLYTVTTVDKQASRTEVTLLQIKE